MQLEDLLQQSIVKRASDLHLASDHVPVIRVDGELQSLNETVLSDSALKKLLKEMMGQVTTQQFEKEWDVDFALDMPNVGRFRVNVFQQAQGVSAAFRMIPRVVPTLESLELPPVITSLTQLTQGLVLLTGPTGSGKSTTVAAMVDAMNHRDALHIITIEDPIEFLYTAQKSLIEQRELGRSTKSFAQALRAALREDPDVIVVGEMRDIDTIRLALTAAETGHLVLATLHAPSAPDSIHRIIDVFPGDEKALVRSMLAESLQAVVAQTLVKRKDQGRIAVMEIMLANTAVRHLIREDNIPQMRSVIQTHAASGMQTFEQHLALLKEKKII